MMLDRARVALGRVRQEAILAAKSGTEKVRRGERGDVLTVARAMDLPDLPRRPRQQGSVWAIGMVRDELDVLPSMLDHLFAQGVGQVLIADNLSTDGTKEFLLKRAAQDPRVHVAIDREPAYLQRQKMTLLARAAWRAGADWIVPADADEFWFAPEGALAQWLSRQKADVVFAAFHHMVPTEADPASLRDSDFFLDGHPSIPGKKAFRSHPLVRVGPGNHDVERPGYPIAGLAIAHALYRSPRQVARKARQGAAASRLTGEVMETFAPHWDVASRLSDAEILDVWERISAGLPDPRIKYEAKGPMVRVRPLRWNSWDEDGEIAAANRS